MPQVAQTQPQATSDKGGQPTLSTWRSLLHRVDLQLASCWYVFVERFRFLPIRFKLGLIILAIVIAVLIVFSFIVLRSQEAAFMRRMSEVNAILLRNLSDSAKGDLLLGKNDQVKEAVLRLKNSDIPGLKQVAIVNRSGNEVFAFDKNGEPVEFDDAKRLLGLREFTVLEKQNRFEYYSPIYTRVTENGTEKNVLLGVAYVSFSKSATLGPIRQARKIAVISAFIITLLAMIGINLLSGKMVDQIQRLSDGAREVGSGNLNIEIPVKSKDELGQLAHEFNNMIRQLREKLHMQKFVSKLTVDMIHDSVRADGRISKGVKRKVTVLFSDVRDFSSVAERLDPGEIVKLINIYFDLQTRIIESHNGIVDKFMGDQIMAIFQEKSMADDAMRAAVEIQRQVRLINHERHLQKKTFLEMGIGINRGPAVIGNMGSSHRMDYTVIGDVVNVASRLCAVAKAGQIITSFEVAKRVNGSYPTSRLKSISVKGRTQRIEVCEVDYHRDIIT
ncbi:MAG: adenylate/guanylate cyclase domain-containing protein [Calditrichaeota bacterium]|nr:adenylate/guanylate cyclase domain-containing protein [Calditrichota bacterium]